MPLMPTNAYIGPIGCSPPKTSRTICPPTTNEEPGEEWSTPEGSKTTPSYAQRIGQSTFQTSLPRLNSLQQHGLAVAAGAGVGQLGGLVVVRGDRGQVALADRAVRLVRVVPGAAPRCRRPRRPRPSPRRPPARPRRPASAASCCRAALSFVRYRSRTASISRALAHREQDLLAVGARGVLLGLADAAVLDAQLGQRLDHRRLEVLGPVRVRAAGRGRAPRSAACRCARPRTGRRPAGTLRNRS